jgi:hypothetical protein
MEALCFSETLDSIDEPTWLQNLAQEDQLTRSLSAFLNYALSV